MEIKDRESHRISLTAIIHKDGRYLIMKRSPDKKAFPNKWTVPGGGLEVDDYIDTPKTTGDHWYYAIENALRREVREECNLEIEKPKYLLDIAFIRPDGVPVVILSYYADYKSGEIKLSKGSTEYVWVTAEETKNYDLIEGIAEEIEMVDKLKISDRE
ncbi:NUDIX domain-containing protein [Patescibacteria group bacterium]|nr:NUDIX domain-containing protein [Patescibacteria group bacterium]MCG2694643.1 NUDIX domain-containing protein [Candidatus Parcubacteria bacterium]